MNKKLLQSTSESGVWVMQIDNSSTEQYTTCPTSAFHSLVMGRSMKGRAALTYGSAIHAALEEFYAATPEELLDEDTIINAMAARVQEEFAGVALGIDEWRTPDKAIDTCIRYRKEYLNDPLRVMHDEAGPIIERGFSLPLGSIDMDYPTDISIPDGFDENEVADRLFDNPDKYYNEGLSRIDVYWTGKIDLCVTENNRYWVLDHKTSSIMGPTYWKDFELSQPTIGYVWAAEQMFNKSFDGLWANVIVGRKPTKSGVNCSFERRRVPYTRETIDQFVPNTQIVVNNFVHALFGGGIPRHTKWCVAKYGMCPYHEVCSAPAKQRAMILNSGSYKDNDWSPLA